mmetsp:Transcript_125588/g.337018  ORF Transcript_125588/g.337018 Transcript_125588/m.337018 type:complete len:348 (-) Transcript_125588:504-1547(-)
MGEKYPRGSRERERESTRRRKCGDSKSTLNPRSAARSGSRTLPCGPCCDTGFVPLSGGRRIRKSRSSHRGSHERHEATPVHLGAAARHARTLVHQSFRVVLHLRLRVVRLEHVDDAHEVQELPVGRQDATEVALVERQRVHMQLPAQQGRRRLGRGGPPEVPDAAVPLAADLWGHPVHFVDPDQQGVVDDLALAQELRVRLQLRGQRPRRVGADEQLLLGVPEVHVLEDRLLGVRLVGRPANPGSFQVVLTVDLHGRVEHVGHDDEVHLLRGVQHGFSAPQLLHHAEAVQPQEADEHRLRIVLQVVVVFPEHAPQCTVLRLRNCFQHVLAVGSVIEKRAALPLGGLL